MLEAAKALPAKAAESKRDLNCIILVIVVDIINLSWATLCFDLEKCDTGYLITKEKENKKEERKKERERLYRRKEKKFSEGKGEL